MGKKGNVTGETMALSFRSDADKDAASTSLTKMIEDLSTHLNVYGTDKGKRDKCNTLEAIKTYNNAPTLENAEAFRAQYKNLYVNFPKEAKAIKAVLDLCGLKNELLHPIRNRMLNAPFSTIARGVKSALSAANSTRDRRSSTVTESRASSRASRANSGAANILNQGPIDRGNSI